MAVTVTPWNDLTSQNSEESNADIEKNSNLQGVLKKVPVALQSGMGAPPQYVLRPCPDPAWPQPTLRGEFPALQIQTPSPPDP